MSLVVIIMMVVYFTPSYSVMQQTGHRCISLCKETVSRRTIHFCLCRTPYGGTLDRSVTKLRQWPSDGRSCNQTGMRLRTCRVQFHSDGRDCHVQIGFEPNATLQDACGQEVSCDWDIDDMADSWNKHTSIFYDLKKAGCNKCALNYFGPDLISCSNCMTNTTKMLKVDVPLTSNWKPDKYKTTPVSNLTLTPLIYAARLGRIELFDFLVSKDCNLSMVDENGDNILHQAAIGGSVDIAKHIISLGIVDKESKGYSGRTPLMHAARHGHREMFDLLVNQGCKLTSVDEDKANVLHMACIGGNLDIVKNIVTRNNIDIESKNVYKMTPLMMASWNGHVKVFDFLLSKGSKITSANVKQLNVLHLACEAGREAMVKHIFSLKFGHRESKATDMNFTPLMFAVRQGNIDIFDFLVKQGCDTTAVDNGDEDNSIIHIAIKAGKLDMVKRILSVDSSLKEKANLDGYTPLLYAAAKGHVDIFDFLLDQGCNKMATNEEVSNILHVACESGSLDMVKRVFFMNLFDKESEDDSGYTPLLDAAFVGSCEVVKFLKEQGCKMTATAQSNNALHLATRADSGNVDLVRYIVSLNIVDKDDKTNRGRTAIMNAAYHGHEEMFFYLLDRGCNVGGVDRSSNNILHCACIGGKVAIVDKLLSARLVDKDSKGNKGYTAIMTAVDNGVKPLDMVRCLVKHGCDTHGKFKEGDNLLHMAIQNGDLPTVKYLLSLHVFDKEEKGSGEQTALLQAVSNEELEVFEYLLSQGCSVTPVDEEDNNILHLAGLNGNVDLTKIILALPEIEELLKMKNSDDYTPLELAKDYDFSDVVDLIKG